MLEIWLMLLLLLVVLTAFVLPVRNRQALTDEKGEAIAVYRQEAKQLQRQFDQGVMTADVHAALLAELDRKSVAAVSAITRRPLAYRQSLWLPAVIVTALLTVSGGFFFYYQQSGGWRWAQFRQQHQAAITEGLFDAEAVENFLSRHSADEAVIYCFAMQQTLLKRYDADPDVLSHTARCHLRTGYVQLANDAVTRGLQHHAEHSGLNYLAAELDFVQNARLSETALSRLLTVLKNNPKHISALYLLTLDSYQQHRMTEARIFLEQLQQATADNPAAQTAIRQNFAELIQGHAK